MSKRQTSLLEDLIISLMKLPWWGCLISAIGFWGLGQILLARLDPAEMHSALFAPLTKFIFNGFAILCVFIAPFGALKSLTRKVVNDLPESALNIIFETATKAQIPEI